jgi:Cu-Zn family superoxide dismutase
MQRLSLAVLALSLAAAPALAAEPQVAFKAGDGAARGSGALSEGPTGVMLRLELTGLTPGWHAVHFHAKGDCSDAAFNAAGGHINHATPKPHGLLNPAGPDFGDLPNVFAGADGAARADVFSALVSLNGQGGRPALLDADGSAIVVHASADDYKTQPIGGAGARIACAVVK